MIKAKKWLVLQAPPLFDTPLGESLRISGWNLPSKN